MTTPNDTTKQCSKCKRKLPIIAFNKDSRASDGLRCECKECRAQDSAKYYEKNAEKIKSYVADWQRANYDKWLEYARKSRENNPAPYREAVKRSQSKYPEHVKARDAVKYAVKKGKLPPVDKCLCVRCGKQAEAYHHWSYLKEHRLDVIPVCDYCHKQIHIEIEKAQNEP